MKEKIIPAFEARNDVKIVRRGWPLIDVTSRSIDRTATMIR